LISSSRHTPIAKPNASVPANERWQAAYDAGFYEDDWDPMRALCAADVVYEDRRRLVLLSGGRDLMIASLRERARIGARADGRLVGTAGDRVSIGRSLWSGGPPDGRFEIEYLMVIEVDAAGLVTAMILFDLDDPGAAQREAWARWAAIDPGAAPWVQIIGDANDGFNARDLGRFRTLFADDIIVEDHRRTGFGRLEGADAYLQSIVVLWDLAPDQRIELGWFWPAVERHGAVITLRRAGTLADGGLFESDYLWLVLATRGRITRIEMFELEHVERATARLAELRPES
jgi:hypothetical protein